MMSHFWLSEEKCSKQRDLNFHISAKMIHHGFMVKDRFKKYLGQKSVTKFYDPRDLHSSFLNEINENELL